METRLPRSPRAKEMRSGPVTPSQDDMTDTAAPVSQTSIARSMSRYRGSRRNVRSHEPALPSTRQTSTTQRTPTREQSNVPGPDRAFLPNHDKMNGFYQASRVENLQSVAPAPPKIGRARRGLRRERNQAATSAEDSVQPQSQVYPQYQAQAEKEDGSRRTDVIHSQRRTLAKGDVGEELWRGKARRHTGSIKGKSGTGPSRPPQDQGVDAGKIDSPRDRPANSHYTNGDIPSFSQRIAAQAPRPQAFRNGSSREELKRMISGPIPTMEQESPAHPSMRPPEASIDALPSNIAAEGLSLAPRFDAPISAVNAGQRMVRVKHEGNDIFLPVTPSTTPVDVIRAAARKMSARIDENSTVLLESFKQLGLERPLRKYEHIRDVLNSWDNDAQNTLMIIPSPSGGKDDDLDVRRVSETQPGETSVHLYHSQKPGSWDKRWITLRSDGQVVVAKRRGVEASNICHLSDFDIYVPTARYASKQIKPPKKICFAVKSQQKSSMFVTTENFVHFFSTNDRSLGTAWYTAVQEWRSWYLVNVMGEGQKSANELNGKSGWKQPLGNEAPALRAHHRPLTEGHVRPQQSGPSASPLPTRSRTIRSTAPPQPRKLTKDPLTNAPTTHLPSPSIYQTPAVPPPQADPFDPSSLLGRTYTQKQKALQRSQPPTLDAPPPLPATAHRNDSPHSRPGTAHRTSSPQRPEALITTNTNSGLKRHSSQRTKPKPLVDLTPVYQEPPQHSKKGRGVVPPQIPVGGLVEVATSPDRAVDAPPATTWRRPELKSPS